MTRSSGATAADAVRIAIAIILSQSSRVVVDSRDFDDVDTAVDAALKGLAQARVIGSNENFYRTVYLEAGYDSRGAYKVPGDLVLPQVDYLTAVVHVRCALTMERFITPANALGHLEHELNQLATGHGAVLDRIVFVLHQPGEAEAPAHEECSADARAERLMGRRDDAGPIGVILFSPAERGYRCPKHDEPGEQDDAVSGQLQWSEYNGFVWCPLCNRDYPSALCCGEDLDRAVEVYLDTVGQAVSGQAVSAVGALSRRLQIEYP